MKKDKTFFMTRHSGAKTWAEEEGFKNVEHVSHFDPSIVRQGDTVIGTLPVHLAAVVCERGGHYYHLVLDLPAEARGKELTADDMRSYGARVIEFAVHDIS